MKNLTTYHLYGSFFPQLTMRQTCRAFHGKCCLLWAFLINKTYGHDLRFRTLTKSIATLDLLFGKCHHFLFKNHAYFLQINYTITNFCIMFPNLFKIQRAEKLDKPEKGCVLLNHWSQRAILLTDYDLERGAKGYEFRREGTSPTPLTWPPLS